MKCIFMDKNNSIRQLQRLYFFALTFQMVFPASSATSKEPSAITATPTGLPYTSFLLSFAMKPVRKSSGAPEGFPFLNGTKATLYPENRDRFHDPCSPINAPPRYL